ncbi:hypothetical protein JCM24511_06907 [Saitozyma sp. JCM 24511]|nr:hypothetical protein JCM24511_06907 [Saitozyma sp. JCM 24511]
MDSMSTISPSPSPLAGLPPPPAPLLALFRPLPVSLARTRLKSNFLALLFFSFVQTLFTPYLSIRRSVIYLIDEHVQHRVGGQGSYAAAGFWWLESAVTFILIWNMLEAAVSIKWPRQSATAVPQGLKMTPSRPSSPLTRAYITPDRFSTPSKSTPLPPSSLQRFSTPPNPGPYASTPSRSPNPPHRSSPLSASTAKILNLPSRAPESTGLFFDPNASASPSKLAQSQMQQSQPQLQNQSSSTQSRNEVAVTGTGTGTGRTVQTGTGEFVLIEGAEREWVDNVWKGVRGKGGRVGI